jgi:hypothetical protein
VQRPTEPPTTQLRQAPSQASLQQTPSTHCREKHSSFWTQDWPFCLGPHLPTVIPPTVVGAQAMPGSQSSSPSHELLQPPATHR